MPADWRLPPGVSRSLWEFAADAKLARDEADHLAHSPLLEFDRHVVNQWFDRPGDLVDLGCGTGRSLVDFSQREFTCTGVDLSQPSLVVAAKLLAERGLPATLIRGNLCELECLPDGAFDYALLLFGTLGMVEGIAGRTAVLRQAHRLLRPGGRLALHVHSLWPHLFLSGGRRWLAADIWKRLRKTPDAGDTHRDYRGIPQIYHHVFSRHEIHKLLRMAGFQIQQEVPVGAVRANEPALNLEQVGWLKNLRATGWLIEAARRSQDGIELVAGV
ncbi:MAG: class I SAM-dependent methyltransferase [Planctomycetota bacterium]|nr:class I SAM-dependent methyltransferase [Planctomycetota bacterium]